MTAENSSPNLRMTWEDAVEAQAEWHKDIARQSRVTELTAEQMEGIVTIMEFDDGFRWVDVQTEICLKHEGTVMGHCVGQGGYTQGVKEGTTKILSLRDGNNNPHATIEGVSEHPIHITPEMLSSGQLNLFVDNALETSFVDLAIRQIKGKENKGVVRKYREYVEAFLTKFQIDEYGLGGLDDLESCGLFILRKGGYTNIEDAGQEVATMDDGTSWHRVDGNEVELKSYHGDMVGKWFLYDKNGRSIGSMHEEIKGTIDRMSFPYGEPLLPYKEHIQKAFETGIRPDSFLYQNWDSQLNSIGLGVVNNKVGEPQTVGKHKGTTTAGEVYATERGSGGNIDTNAGDVYWLINGDKIQSQFVIRKDDEKGYSIYFDKNHGLPNGSMPTFLKQFQDMFPNITISYILVQDRVINVNEMEWTPEAAPVKWNFIMEEDGVKFYESDEASQSGSKWYNAIDKYNHLIFNMSIGDVNFKVKMVNDNKVAGYYAVYLLEHLDENDDVDIGHFTDYSSFARELLEETNWFQGERSLTWYVEDETFPIHLVETHSYDDDTEEDVIDEDTTMKQYYDATQMYEYGFEDDHFAKEYEQVYRGGNTGWDDEHQPDDDGQGRLHIRTDWSVEGIGEHATVTHPVSGGSLRIQK
jgi:hypothetical protein